MGLVFCVKKPAGCKGVRTHMLFKPVHNGNRKRYSYARIKEVLKMPHLIDLQRKSYEWFIREGLHDAFQDVSPIKDATNSLELSFENLPSAIRSMISKLARKRCNLCGSFERRRPSAL